MPKKRNQHEETVEKEEVDIPVGPEDAGQTGEGEGETVSPEDFTKEQLFEAVQIATRQRDEYLEMSRRVQAEFDNFRRRNATVRTDARQEGVREAIAALLPTVDNLERALESAEENQSALYKGIEMTLKQMLSAFECLGVTEVPALGAVFDPELHNAVLRGTAEEGEPGTVCEVLQKGYTMGEKMIRYAMVKVVAE